MAVKTKSKKDKIERSTEIPHGMTAEVAGHNLTLKKEGKSLSKTFLGIKVEKHENSVVFSSPKSSKNERKLIMTYAAHLQNMIKGLEKEFSYKLKVCSVHFPMTVTVDKGTHQLVVKNFLGEKKERRARILPHVNVEVKGDEIFVTSHDVENAGQTAANFETVTKVNYRDRRVFQDGIFLTERKGEKI